MTYRQNTELMIEAWHWNPRGTWSNSARKEGYFTGSAEPTGEKILHSWAYPLANYPPLGLLGTAVDFEIEGRPAPALGEAMTTRFRVVDPEFFQTMRVPLAKGRAFKTGDAHEAHSVAIVSEAFARRFFPGEDAIDKRFRPHFPGGDAFWYPRSDNLPLRIVGIARDVRDNDIDTSETPQMYLPYAQNPSRIMHLLVRTCGVRSLGPRRWAGRFCPSIWTSRSST
ncbi:MAG: ABC transporter permease [Bryobacteraceae bacterium]